MPHGSLEEFQNTRRREVYSRFPERKKQKPGPIERVTLWAHPKSTPSITPSILTRRFPFSILINFFGAMRRVVRLDMKGSHSAMYISDNFGRRSGLERRKCRVRPQDGEKRKSSDRRRHSPERRTPSDRRMRIKRRQRAAEKSGIFWSFADKELSTLPGDVPICIFGPDRRGFLLI